MSTWKVEKWSSGQTGQPGHTAQTGQTSQIEQTGQTDLTFKLDFPGNLCRAAFGILAMFYNWFKFDILGYGGVPKLTSVVLML